jgi:uncharacterized protein YjbJ (UPF0337 family)
MNLSIAAGKIDQLKGKAKQSLGEAIGDDRLADSGTVDQVTGASKEAWGNAKDALHSITDSVKSCAASDHAEPKQRYTEQQSEAAAHDIRARLTSTAQNVKDAITAKTQQIQRDLHHPA